MFHSRLCFAVFTLFAVSGCATVVSGSSQDVMIDSDPAGANCRVSRAGQTVGIVPSTPGVVHVDRRSIGLNIVCTKPGYNVAETAAPTSINGWIVGNVLIGGLIGIVVDFSTGAAYHYDSHAMLSLQAAPGGSAPVAGSSYPSKPQVAYVPPGKRDSDPLVVPPASPKGDATYVCPKSND